MFRFTKKLVLGVLQSQQFATKNGLGDIHKTDGRLLADVVSHSETQNGVVWES